MDIIHERHPMTFEARNCTLRDILTRPKPLKIPRYQRHYEWTVTEMDQLLSDLTDSFKRPPSRTTPDKYHFIGSFILHNGTDKDPDEVVDGQQRLTSLSILLAVARDLLTDAAVRSPTDGYVTIPADPFTGDPATERLKLHRGDEAFYKLHIVPLNATAEIDRLPKQATESDERLRLNCSRARAWLKTKIKSEDLPTFIRYVCHNCRVILLTVNQSQDAFRIFETINSRGRPLRNEEILRFSLIEYATKEDKDDKDRTALLSKWDKVEEQVGQNNMTRFLAQWRAQQSRGTVTGHALHRDIIDSFATPADAKAFLKSELRQQADIFGEIKSARVQGLGTTKIKFRIDRTLKSLALVNFDDWLPIAILLIERFRAQPDVLLEHMKGLDRLVWSYYFRHDDIKVADDRQKRFGDILHHLTGVAGFDPSACRFNLGDAEKFDMRDVIKSRIDPKWVPLKSLLLRIEDVRQNGRAKDYLKSYTIEHILPQAPTDKYWLSRFDDRHAVARDYSERIGNLCLVSYDVNKALGVLPFPDKQQIAKDEDVSKSSHLAAGFEEENDWNKDTIERRSKRILTEFCNEFDVHA
jgi:Protein of unknown function DUF262/Protein of unknown function (DUF1524)